MTVSTAGVWRRSQAEGERLVAEFEAGELGRKAFCAARSISGGPGWRRGIRSYGILILPRTIRWWSGMNTVFEILKLLSVGLVAGVFSSMLANRDYRQRKWWELRVAAYQSTIDALSDLVHYFDQHFNATINMYEMKDDARKKLDDQWQQAFTRVRKAADSGAFLFSSEANKVLRGFIDKDSDPNQDWFDYLDAKLGLAKNCLDEMVQHSKRDLRLRTSWLDRIF